MVRLSYFLGLDTSCYTTSLALIDSKDNLIARAEIPLHVKSNKGGLRQSEGVFQHVKNLPEAFQDIANKIDQSLYRELKAIAVSTKPRPIEDSYMPVFLVGKSQADVLGSTLNLPIYYLSHQEGHIGAGIYDQYSNIRQKPLDEFLVLHVSGGTTELLYCKSNHNFTDLNIEIIGGTQDISAGQLIDRTAKLLDLPFPGGPAIEKLATQLPNSETDIPDIPISVKSKNVNFSGAETFLKRTIQENKYTIEAISASLQNCIASSLSYMLENAQKQYRISTVLLVGGVMSNNYIKNYLQKEFTNTQLLFSAPDLSTDNAVGVAWIGKNNYHYI